MIEIEVREKAGYIKPFRQGIELGGQDLEDIIRKALSKTVKNDLAHGIVLRNIHLTVEIEVKVE